MDRLRHARVMTGILRKLIKKRREYRDMRHNKIRCVIILGKNSRLFEFQFLDISIYRCFFRRMVVEEVLRKLK